MVTSIQMPRYSKSASVLEDVWALQIASVQTVDDARDVVRLVFFDARHSPREMAITGMATPKPLSYFVKTVGDGTVSFQAKADFESAYHRIEG